MFHHGVALPCCNTIIMAAQRPQKQQQQQQQRQRRATKKSKPEKKQSRKSNETRVGFGNDKTEPQWRCVERCGACCKLDKGPAFATPEEIFDDPSDIQLYRSLMGPDGWCINYDKTTRKCSIYSDRPYFCRVEPGVFESLYGIDKKKFNKEACGCCRDTIKAIYDSLATDTLKRCPSFFCFFVRRIRFDSRTVLWRHILRSFSRESIQEPSLEAHITIIFKRIQCVNI